jgi:EF hand
MKALSTLLLALAACSSFAQAADAPKQRPGAAGAGAGGPYREKMQQMALQKFDANKNGTLDPNEKAAMMKAMQERKGGAPKGGASGTGGAPKGGSPGAKGGGQMQEMFLQKFDANKNGVLDPDEKAAAMKAMQERKGKSGTAPGAPGIPTYNPESGVSKFRRPPTSTKGDSADKASN